MVIVKWWWSGSDGEDGEMMINGVMAKWWWSGVNGDGEMMMEWSDGEMMFVEWSNGETMIDGVE